MKKVSIKIDNKKYLAPEGYPILRFARENNIYIPALCHHPDFKAKGNCGVCVVEIKGERQLKRACATKIKAGMEIKTNSVRVQKSRNLNIELAFASHVEKCATCIWRPDCELLSMAKRYDLEINRFPDRKKKRPTYKFANAVELDSSQCIDCRNCVDACSLLQKIDYLEIKGKGAEQEIVPKKDKKFACIYCGQCAVHCPVSAAQEQSNWQEVEALIKDKSKVVVAQFAPSIRVSIGEEFAMKHGNVVTGQLTSALKELGFDHVFDVNFGADITTMVEAEELVERIKTKGKMPMMTSCCPAWVKYVEFYHPELIPNLTTSRSPHIHLGGIIKSYWAKQMKISPDKIRVVSIMPCTAKKFEASRSELKLGGNNPVDLVITTREFAWMLKKNNIDFKNLKSTPADNILAEYSGAAAIYGGSGGVMESALRTSQYFLSKKNCCERIDFKEVRGLEGFKEAELKLGKKKVKVGVVNGIGNIDQVLNRLNDYHYIEVMACPGGCIGGGGQPIPTNNAIRQKRIQALYSIDKKQKVRQAHNNKGVTEVMDWLGQNRKEHSVLHTRYKRKFE